MKRIMSPSRVRRTASMILPGSMATAWTQAHFSMLLSTDKLIKELWVSGGVHLLLYCIKTGRIPPTFVTNYRLLCDFFFEEKIPVALIVTHLEKEDLMDDWYARNEGSFDSHAVKCVDHACITAVANLDPKGSE
ncbi:uncharacterized protein BJ212DRAFT_1518993 [Suillus subaureus]|uniref:Uncharacterized protein n=1 Tax=Suillus subaureus TaxID=48587 RepID=A0A9P7E666_9AGAM|nr:uncharacterized protein BJ212DRAFT_1518993 [Suillus subaureus]KAG1812479.1 hypothetical protein BJ212DRAFT_1518993 [Suillus subaureus]